MPRPEARRWLRRRAALDLRRRSRHGEQHDEKVDGSVQRDGEDSEHSELPEDVVGGTINCGMKEGKNSAVLGFSTLLVQGLQVQTLKPR